MRKAPATTPANKAEREAERDRQRKAFQEAYDSAHAGPARMRKLIRERIEEPERSRLIALAGSATEFVWARSISGIWLRFPVVYKDADVVAILYGKDPRWVPIYLSADVLRTESPYGIAVSPRLNGECSFFYSQKAKEMEEEVAEAFKRVARGTFAYTGFDPNSGSWRIGIDFGGPTTAAVARIPACLTALRLTANATEHDVRTAFRRLVKTAHPDQGGTDEAFVALQKNYQAALALVRRSK